MEQLSPTQECVLWGERLTQISSLLHSTPCGTGLKTDRSEHWSVNLT